MSLGVTVASLSAGLASRLLASGIQRVGSLTFQKAMRISRIEQTLKGSAQRNSNVKLAMDDFETVIGNRYGEYNEKLAQFLEELERGGLITAMVEDALLERRSEEVKIAFAALHARAFSKQEGNSEELFGKLTGSFVTTFRVASKDKMTAEMLKIIYKNLSARCDQIDQALQLTNKDSGRSADIPIETLRAALLKIARGLQNTTKQVRVETNKGTRSVDISKIYIPPKLKYRDTKKNAEMLTRAGAVVRPRGRIVMKQEGGDAEWHIDPSLLQTITYNDLKLSFSRVIILGDPGGGKSTICQNLCFDLAKQAATALTADNKPTAQLQKFPIRIVLRAFEKARTVEPQLSIYEFILRDLKHYVSLDRPELEHATSYLLTSGAAVLAFDGLDEILVTAQRRDFVNLVIGFCNQYPLCPTLITSRLIGYDDAPLSEDFEELILERFDKDEIERYLFKFFKVIGDRGEQEATQYASDFLRQTASNAADLRTNPLMLGLMAWLYNARGDVPSNRPEIYRECAILMFERWDPDRDIKADVPADFDKLHLFSTLASKIFGDPELAAGVEERWLTTQIRIYLEGLYENKAQATAGTKAVVKFITGRAWVMTDVGDGIYAFTHQTFLEYFFARHVDENADTVSQVLDAIIPHVIKNEWDVVAHLSLQIKTYRSLRRQNQAIELLIDLLNNKTHPPDKRRTLALFSARSLEYLIASEAQVKALVEQIFTEATNTVDDDQILPAIVYCAFCSAERRQFVRKLLLDLIVKAFKASEQPTIGCLFKLLSSFRSRREALIQSSLFPPDLREESRVTVRRMVIDRAPISEFFASVSWSWFGLIDEALLRKHGLATYFNIELEASHFGVDGLTTLVLAGMERYGRHLKWSKDSKPDVERALAAVGRLGFTGPPLKREDFREPFLGATAPLSVWRTAMRFYRKSGEVLAGAFFIYLLVNSIRERLRESEGYTSKEMAEEQKLHGDIVSNVLTSRDLKALNYYPQIVRIANGSVFDSQPISVPS